MRSGKTSGHVTAENENMDLLATFSNRLCMFLAVAVCFQQVPETSEITEGNFGHPEDEAALQTPGRPAFTADHRAPDDLPGSTRQLEATQIRHSRDKRETRLDDSFGHFQF